MISLRQIQFALAVRQTLHFKKAAHNCAVSQSALSTALAEMEKQLGFQLFERNNKQVLVTPLGEEALDKAQRIKQQVDDLMSMGSRLGAPLSTPLSLGMIPTICPFLLPMVLPEVRREFPCLDLRIEEEQSHVLLSRVRAGELDAAVLALPYAAEGLLSFSFWNEDFFAVFRSDDPLAQKAGVASADLDAERLMLLKEGHCLKDHALAACRLPDASSGQLSATNLGTLVELVAGGLGITLVPQIALAQLVDQKAGLTAVPLVEPGPHRELALIVRPNYPNLRDIELLKDRFRRLLLSKTAPTKTAHRAEND